MLRGCVSRTYYLMNVSCIQYTHYFLLDAVGRGVRVLMLIVMMSHLKSDKPASRAMKNLI